MAGMAGERVGEALQAGVDVLTAAFDEAVGEEGTTAELRARVAVREAARAAWAEGIEHRLQLRALSGAGLADSAGTRQPDAPSPGPADLALPGGVACCPRPTASSSCAVRPRPMKAADRLRGALHQRPSLITNGCGINFQVATIPTLGKYYK